MAMATELFEIDFTNGPLTALASNSWTDVSAYVLGCNTRRGRQYDLDRFETGAGRVSFDNSDRTFEPGYAGSAFYPYIKPLRKFRWTTTAPGGSARRVFTGHVTEFPPIYEGDTSTVTVGLVDGFEMLALADLVGTLAAKAHLGDRVTDVLNAISWPAADRDLATGVSSIQADTFAYSDGQKALAHLFDVNDTEFGALFMGKDGKVVFHDRNTRRAGSYLTSQATFNDQAVSGADFPAARVELAYDRARIYNDVSVTARGGVTQTVSDSPSQTDYGRRSLARAVFAQTDPEALDLANALLSSRKQPSLRVARVELEPWFDDGSHWAGFMDAVLAREISDRITVKVNPPAHPGSSSLQSYALHIEAIEHDLQRDSLEHTVAFECSPVDPTSYWILGTSTLETGAATSVLAF